MTNTPNPKPRLLASDLAHLQKVVRDEINPIIEELIFEVSIKIAEREFDIFDPEEFNKVEDYQFEVVMPVIAGMIYSYSRWEL